MASEKHQQLLDLVHQVGNRFVAIDKDLVIEHGSVKFHASEIDLLGQVARHPGIHPTALAEHLNVTKGAVSQTLARLEKKNAVRRDVDPANNAALKVALTPVGDGALTAFHARIEDEWAAFSEQMHRLGKKEHRAVVDFLKSLKSFLNTLG